MSNLLKDRKFQLWEFKVSHSSMLIRSPKSDSFKENVDIIFVGVEFVSVPTYLEGISIDKPTESEVSELRVKLGKSVSSEDVFILTSGPNRHIVVAMQMKIDSHDLDYFSSPFEFPKP